MKESYKWGLVNEDHANFHVPIAARKAITPGLCVALALAFAFCRLIYADGQGLRLTM